MIALIAAHFAVAALLLWPLRRRPVVGAVLGIAVTLTTAVVALVRGRDGVVTDRVEWISALGLGVDVSLDGFGVLMTVIVAVLGAGVLTYSIAYFDHDGTYARFVGLFVAFAGAMTGLVVAGDLFTMFIFWELTSVCSFLLIGLNDGSPSARTSAVRALLTTGLGGLCLLAGVIVLQLELGTTRFADLGGVAGAGGAVNAAIILVLLGAFTKSAQLPSVSGCPGRWRRRPR